MRNRRLLMYICSLVFSIILLTSCSNNSDTVDTQSRVDLEKKYSDISLRLVSLQDIAVSHVRDIIKCAYSCPPDDPDFKYSDEFLMPTPILTDPGYTVVTASYSGYDWTENRGIVILNVSDETGTKTASIVAYFDESNTLIDASVTNVYEVTYSTLDPIVPAAPITGGDE